MGLRMTWWALEMTNNRLTDEAVEGSDGSVYFSDGSTKYGGGEWVMDLFEAQPYGRLIKYDPSLNRSWVILSDLAFANGVALSPSEDYLLVCESFKFRCLKHWLKGDFEGETEVFIDNLPGAPDNIHLSEDGSYWIALIQIGSRVLDFIHKSKVVKHLMLPYPKLFVKLVQSASRSKAMVVNVGADGKIQKMLDDSNGKVVSFVTAAVEHEGHLYLGSIASNFIGKLSLNSI